MLFGLFTSLSAEKRKSASKLILQHQHIWVSFYGTCLEAGFKHTRNFPVEMLKICRSACLVNGLRKKPTLFKHDTSFRTIISLTTFSSSNICYAKQNRVSGLPFSDNYRSFCSDSDKTERGPPRLMSFEPVLRPEIWLSIRNWVLIKLIIKPYLDSEFVLRDFLAGAKQALVTVSNYISSGEFQSLEGLVENEAISEVKRNYSLMNLKQRQDLSVKLSDILFTFPYQIGIMFNDDSHRRFCEITVVYHVLRGFDETKDLDMSMLEKKLAGEGKDDITICNYRFIREYTKGVQSSWIINRIGHFNFSHMQQ